PPDFAATSVDRESRRSGLRCAPTKETRAPPPRLSRSARTIGSLPCWISGFWNRDLSANRSEAAAKEDFAPESTVPGVRRAERSGRRRSATDLRPGRREGRSGGRGS